MLLVIAAGGLALRLASLFAPGGPLASPTGYDDGVYFSASALLLKGVLPYRDFVFVHPPGVLYFFTLTSWWPDPAAAFAAARVLACVVGAINIVLVGKLASRAAGPFAGVVAAALYAVYPDAVVAERSAYLEPALNLFCLASALVWLRGRGHGWLAGVLCGAACAMKFWGGIWVIASVASAPRGRFRSDVPRFIGGASMAGLLLLAPLALPALRNFIDQTLLFQVSRPPDGLLGLGPRMKEILHGGHLAATLLAAIAIVAMLVSAIRRRGVTREERYFTIAVLLTIAGFAASSSYWNHYNSHLAASQCVLAGLGAAALVRLLERRALSPAQRLEAEHRRAESPSLQSAGVAVLIIALQLPSFRETVRRSHDRELPILAGRDAIRKVVPPHESVFSFDPTWTLAAGRLPPHGDWAPVVVDSYGAMLLDAVQSGGPYRDTSSAFQGVQPQAEVRSRLAASRFAMLGWRGSWQLNGENRAWFAAHFLCVTPEAGERCVWQQLAKPLPPRIDVADGAVAFSSGWYAEEGASPASWRWMSARSVTTLPASSGAMRLQLHFYVPLDGANVAVEIDGKRVDQFVASGGEVIRSYELEPANAAPQTLVITTDRTINPSHSGSTDARELGLSLKRLIWLPRSAWPALAGGASTSSPR